MSCVVHNPNEDWLRGRLSDCREELDRAKVARTVGEIETEIGELEFLLGDQP
jgi:hypothetical protein